MSNVAVIQPKPQLIAGSTPAPIVPTNIEQVWRFADLVAKSGMAPKGLDRPETITVAILHGLEIGLTPLMALQRIAVVNGRPTIWGDAAMGLVRASGLCEYARETLKGEGEKMVAVCTVKRKNETEPATREFSVDDAKKAGLWGKAGPWQQYPKRMLQMRARAFALRDTFADVLGGLYLREEIEDREMRDVTTREEPPAPPEPAQSVIEAEVVLDTAPQPIIVPGTPSPDTDPEGFRKWADDTLGAVTDPDSLEPTFDQKISPFEKQMLPPDWEDIIGLYRKHEHRLAP